MFQEQTVMKPITLKLFDARTVRISRWEDLEEMGDFSPEDVRAVECFGTTATPSAWPPSMTRLTVLVDSTGPATVSLRGLPASVTHLDVQGARVTGMPPRPPGAFVWRVSRDAHYDNARLNIDPLPDYRDYSSTQGQEQQEQQANVKTVRVDFDSGANWDWERTPGSGENPPDNFVVETDCLSEIADDFMDEIDIMDDIDNCFDGDASMVYHCEQDISANWCGA
jgi:hypothetical protein